MHLRCIFVFLLSFLVSFSDDAFGMRKSPILQGNTDLERKIVDIIAQKKRVPREDINGLMTERKTALLKYVNEEVLARENAQLYVFCDGKDNIDLKVNLLKAVTDVEVDITETDLRLLNTRNGKDYEKSLTRHISQRGNSLISALFRATSYSFLINNILSPESLYSELSSVSFAFIRRMADLKSYDCYLGLPKAVIDSNFSRIFPCSRRLMIAICFDEFVRKKLCSRSRAEFFSQYQVTPRVVDEESVEISVTERGNVAGGRNNCRCVFGKKGSGVNPGYILSTNGAKFFIKMFHLASYKKRKGSKDQISEYGTRTYVSSDSLSFQASFRSSVDTKKTNEDFRFDLREPFLYTVLDLLGAGPEFTMVVNPYVHQGIYIATKDVSSSDDNKLFSTFKDIEDKVKGGQLSMQNLVDSDVVLYINELDLLGKLLGLRDLHSENFGFLLNEASIVKDSLKIVDFVYPDFGFEERDVVEDFIAREKRGLNITEDTLAGQIIRIKEAKEMMKDVFSNLEKRVSKTCEKISKSSGGEFEDVLLEARNRVDGYLKEVRGKESEESMLSFNGMPRTNAELIGFSMEKGVKVSYPDAIEGLDGYINVLKRNYTRLRELK
ncbi:MAG: hypothetical protein IJA14_04595 [Alphaproteobacteria bacterium]|nr:hypothetical protein [Alphaproteobacteria bacterium]